MFEREDMTFYEEFILGNLVNAVLSDCLVRDVTFRLFFLFFFVTFAKQAPREMERGLNNFIVCIKNIVEKKKVWTLIQNIVTRDKVIQEELVRKYDK